MFSDHYRNDHYHACCHHNDDYADHLAQIAFEASRYNLTLSTRLLNSVSNATMNSARQIEKYIRQVTNLLNGMDWRNSFWPTDLSLLQSLFLIQSSSSYNNE